MEQGICNNRGDGCLEVVVRRVDVVVKYDCVGLIGEKVEGEDVISSFTR